MNHQDTHTPQTAPCQLEVHHHLDHMERRSHNRRKIVESLRGVGVRTACIAYDGGGDEGQIREISYLDATGQSMPLSSELATSVDILKMQYVRQDDGHWRPQSVVKPTHLEQACEDLAWDIIESLHGYFWNGEGGSGEVTFALAEDGTDVITVQHSDYVLTTEYTETVL